MTDLPERLKTAAQAMVPGTLCDLLVEAACEITRLTDDRDAALADLTHTLSERDAYMQLSDKMTDERDTLRTFSKWVMESWPCGDVDGGDLQDKAIELGLLKLTEPAPREPCGENCACNEYYSPEDFRDGQVMCYRRTTLLMGENYA